MFSAGKIKKSGNKKKKRAMFETTVQLLYIICADEYKIRVIYRYGKKSVTKKKSRIIFICRICPCGEE